MATLDHVAAQLRAAGCVFADEEARLLVDAAPSPDALAALVDRRVAGMPLEHLLGWAAFRRRRVAVAAGVFVPRRRTEYLVDQALALGPAIVVDLCCGCGAVGAALAAELPGVQVHAVDVDPAAVECARRNLPDGHVYQGDLYTPLPAQLRARVDLIVANAPYVPSDEVAHMPAEARDWEPRVALDGGADGLDVQRRIIAEAPEWLAAQGHLLIETSRRQAPGTVAAMRAAGFAARVAESDEFQATVAIGAR